MINGTFEIINLKLKSVINKMSKLDIDGLINQLINSGGKKGNIKEKDISILCKQARDVFMEQPVFLELEAPIKICGKF